MTISTRKEIHIVGTVNAAKKNQKAKMEMFHIQDIVDTEKIPSYWIDSCVIITIPYSCAIWTYRVYVL